MSLSSPSQSGWRRRSGWKCNGKVAHSTLPAFRLTSSITHDDAGYTHGRIDKILGECRLEGPTHTGG